MLRHLRANLWLIGLTLLICSALYPLVLLGIGQAIFSEKANGSLIINEGRVIASRIIAQPFAGDEYFQPRPSAASYNGAASAATNWGASNVLLRERVSRHLGSIVKYRSGPRQGQLAAQDIEAWFQKDRFAAKPGIVAQWASAHPTTAANWIKADPLNTAYVAGWIKQNPNHPQTKPEDLAIPFFTSYSAAHPGTFPVAVEQKLPDGKSEKRIEPVKEGTEIQSIFFEMWLSEHSQADLQLVPADMVMASGSGLDPHITLANALYQLDRVTNKRAAATKRDVSQVRKEIEELLRRNTHAPLGGLVGVDLINVLEVNLALQRQVGTSQN